jgi:N-acetylmuramoyl-L-alanine amidase
VLPTPPPRRVAEAPAAAPRAPSNFSRRTVVIDAGHGGPDTGMRGQVVGGVVLTEKDVTLDVARSLRDALTARGVDVVMTRTRDTLVALADRGRIANARRGDLFVSVHVNAANPAWREPAAARGFETYFLSDARTEDARQVAERENESVRFEAVAPTDGDPLRFIVSDLAQNAHLRESSRLAATVQRRLARVHPGPNRGVHQAGFKVLVTASMPAVLVELGFGSNPAEAAYLVSEHGQRQVADAIADAVIEHLGRYAGARAGGAAGSVARP